MKRNGWSDGGATLAVLLTALSVAIVTGCGPEPAPPPERPRPVAAVTVAPAGAAAQVSYTGDVRARYETALGFRVPGKLIARNVEVGTRVERGALLARLDPSDYQLNIEAARSQLAAARSDFLQAEDDLKRYKDLYEKRFISAAEFDRKQTSFDVAKAKFEQAQAQLGVNQNQSAYTSLHADHDGIITALEAEVGQVLNAGQPVMRLARPHEKEVVVSVPESRLHELKSAQRVAITLWANPGAKFQGRIREVSPSADPVTRTYTAKVTIMGRTPTIQLGMTANVLLGSDNGETVIRLPLTALYQKGQEAAVWIIDPKTSQVVLRPVTVARYTEAAVEIASGLNAGERVVRAGVHKLTPGQKVRVLNEGA